MLEHAQPSIDEHVLDLIANRVTAALRAELSTLLAPDNDDNPARGRGMTVEQVAARLGVARSTVYAHWREWGGYKLGRGEKAPIRFDLTSLPIAIPTPKTASPAPTEQGPKRKPARQRRRDLLCDEPRFISPLDEAA